MNYKKCAGDILALVGGADNVKMVNHCATRLRFNLKNTSKVDLNGLKKVDGVIGVVDKAGQYQVVIGNEVANVHRELIAMGNFDGGTSSADDGEKNTVLSKIIDIISGIFAPIIPVITAAGMLKAVMALAVVFKWLNTTGQTYQFLNFIADAGFFFLPLYLANSAAKKFRCNPYLAMALGGVLLHPNFTTMIAKAKEAKIGLAMFGVPVTMVNYASSVIPIILGVWLMSYIERAADKVSPGPIKFFTKPLITLVVTSFVLLTAVGPLGALIGDLLASGIKAMNAVAPWLAPTVIGVLSPLMVMTGSHYGIIPIGISNLATLKYDTVVGPGMLGSNIAQGGAALAVALKTKNKKVRALGISAGITAVCGITEPAMYGITLKFKKPLIAVMIAGGVSGFWLGINNVARFAPGSPGLLALPGYIGEVDKFGYGNLINALIAIAIAFVIAFVLTYILGFKDEPELAEESGESTAAEVAIDTSNMTESTLYNPIAGKVVPLSQVPDKMFADAIMGKGIAVVPSVGKAYSPMDGEVTMLFDTFHAIGIVGANGEEVIIHIGIDTVKLEGKHFSPKVKAGDKVKKGDLLIEFDIEAINEAGYSTITPMVVTNTDSFAKIDTDKMGDIAVGAPVLRLWKA